VPKCQTKNFKAKRDQKVPNLTYLALRKAKWQPWNGSLYLSVTPKFYTKVLHQTLNPTAELWCKTLSRIMFGV